ncbi:MAG: hypothetical protein QNJ37_15965 [Crocosphaera sp.]|nr:hypothetical protein [Crocosphaera sp.]
MINLDKTVQNAASALLKGDWVAYQRYLRSVPSTKETEFGAPCRCSGKIIEGKVIQIYAIR